MAFVGNAFTGTGLDSAKQSSNTSVRTRSPTVVCAASSDGIRLTRRAALGALAGVVTAVAAGAINPSPALADRTLMAARRSFERYYPRISAGGATLREIGAQLSKGNTSEVAAAVEAREFDVKFRRALNIYATSFSDNYVGQKSRDLQLCTNKLFDELGAMKASSEAEDAVEHYSMAVEAFKKYVKIARLPKETAEGFDNAKAVVLK